MYKLKLYEWQRKRNQAIAEYYRTVHNRRVIAAYAASFTCAEIAEEKRKYKKKILGG
jgi:hypothetical protein